MDDIFYDDSELDSRSQELRLADNDTRRREKLFFDKGYLDGLEWSETNYQSVMLQDSDRVDFNIGFSVGKEAAQSKEGLF